LKFSSIDNWGTNQWLSMDYSFYGCTNMVGTYTDNPDTSLTTGLYSTFRGCSNFNSPLIFDCSLVTSTSQMLWDCVLFNSEVSLTNTSNLLSTQSMFYNCTVFNSSVTIDDTSNVTSMYDMFRASVAFNQPVSFDTSSVTNMQNMFRFCFPFDQDISGFNISSLTSANDMLHLTAFSTTNYDLLLVAWEGQTHNNTVTLHAGTAKYSAGAPATARAALITDAWTITDGGAV